MFTTIFVSCRQIKGPAFDIYEKLRQKDEDTRRSKQKDDYKQPEIKVEIPNNASLHIEEVPLISTNEKTFNQAVKRMLTHEIENYLENSSAPMEMHSILSAKIFLENTDWRIVSNNNEKIVFDVSWFKYSRRDMSDKSNFLSAHKDYYNLNSVLKKDLPNPILQVIARNLIYKLAENESFSCEEEKKNYLHSTIRMISHNTFDGIIRILINKFLEHGNEILSPSDVEVVNKSPNGQIALFNFTVLKGKQSPYREILMLLNQPDHIYHIEEKNLLTSYQGFISSILKANKFQTVEIQETISPSLVAIVQVYERINHEFNSLMRKTKIMQRNDDEYTKVSDANSEIIKKLFRMAFLKKLKKSMIFQLIKCMQKKREL